MRKYLALFVAGLMLAGAALTQTEDKPAAEKPPEGQIGGLRFLDVTEVTVVEVEVNVSDKNGPVTGLTRDDFEVYQNGKLQELTNFYYFSKNVQVRRPAPPVATPTPVPTAVPEPEPEPEPVRQPDPRFLALYVDNENIQPFNRNRVINTLQEWVRNHLVEPDQAMVVSYQRSMKTQQAFTSDPEEIVDALRALKKYTGGRTSTVSSRREIEEYISQNSNDRRTMERALGRVRAFAREQRNDLVFTVRTLQSLIDMMAGLPGKKSIIYVSDGLPMTPGLELFYEIQDRYQDPSAISQSRDFDGTELFRSLVTAASASGVTLYTVDARGLEAELGSEAENRQARASVSASIARSNYQDSLLYMADQTGGRAIVNTNDAGPGLERIAEELHTFYSLGYRLVPSGTDRLHQVRVKVKGHPEYRLSYRRTFIEKSLATRVADRVVSGLAFDLGDNPLGIEVSTSEPAPASGGRWTLPVEVRVPLNKVALIPDGEDYVGYLMVYYAARDADGKQSDLQRSEATVRVPRSEYERAQMQYYALRNSLLLEPGNYRISVGVRDQLTNQAGYQAIKKPVRPELLR